MKTILCIYFLFGCYSLQGYCDQEDRVSYLSASIPGDPVINDVYFENGIHDVCRTIPVSTPI